MWFNKICCGLIKIIKPHLKQDIMEGWFHSYAYIEKLTIK